MLVASPKEEKTMNYLVHRADGDYIKADDLSDTEISDLLENDDYELIKVPQIYIDNCEIEEYLASL